jgi:proline dehydrogenase
MSQLSFDNTQIAFSAKSNADLKQSYWLFKMISSPAMVKFGSAATKAALGLHLPISGVVKATIFKQFCGGENIAECSATIDNLGKFNIGTILDYSVEGKETEKDFERTCLEIIQTVERAAGNQKIPFSVFKTTGIARLSMLEKKSSSKPLSSEEMAEWEAVVKRVDRICAAAHQLKVPVFIDAEESWIQPAIDALALEMMLKYNKERAIVYNTYQLYRKDRYDFLSKNIFEASQQNFFLGAKLVRGAYMEKERERAASQGYPSPIQDSKEATDRDFDRAVALCMENIERVAFCAGTHNEKSSATLVDLMKKKNLSNTDKRIYFSQLLGMSDHISYNLAAQGYCVAKYVPYGPVREVLPYLIRRAQENTSVKGQTGRELSLIIREKERRSKR